MSVGFEEIDRRSTPIGEISVRRRLEPTLGVEVHEVKLGDEFLMSSLFTVAEVELATLALAELPTGEGEAPELDVLVGGLGLGYTARAVLDDPRVRRLHVVESLGAVVEWHEEGLLPLGDELTSDPRCRLVEGDFFDLVGGDPRDGSEDPGRPDGPVRWHAVLVDIDHSPRHLLHPSHARFYEPAGVASLAGHLHPGGVFGLWSDGAPDTEYVRTVEEVFASCEAHVVTFPNPLTGGESASTVYVARRG